VQWPESMSERAESPGPARVEKHGRGPPLAAPIRRVLYLSSEGTAREHEVWPPPNPALLAQLDAAAAVVYGMGSLYTSICPSLALQARCPLPSKQGAAGICGICGGHHIICVSTPVAACLRRGVPPLFHQPPARSAWPTPAR